MTGTTNFGIIFISEYIRVSNMCTAIYSISYGLSYFIDLLNGYFWLSFSRDALSLRDHNMI